MQFLQGVVFVLLLETLALVVATEWLLRKTHNLQRGGKNHGN